LAEKDYYFFAAGKRPLRSQHVLASKIVIFLGLGYMSRRNKKIFFFIGTIAIILCSVKMISDRVFCYDTNVAHPHIVEMAVDLYNKNYGQNLTKNDLKCIVQGAIDEDTPTRWLNHFYDPVRNRGLKGAYATAINWATDPKLQASYALGDQSWQRALDDYKNGDKKRARHLPAMSRRRLVRH
jgi:hypothetical protein